MRKIDKHQQVPNVLTDELAEKHLAASLQNGHISDAAAEIYRKVSQVLFDLYEGKCCYCESRLSGFEIEHYRPKSKYPWLVFAWDNLMPICSTCNRAKLNQFPTGLAKAEAPINPTAESTQQLASALQSQEQPILLNPELDAIDERTFYFETQRFEIHSQDQRAQETIKTLDLNRYALLQRRRQIMMEFITDYNNILSNENEMDKPKELKQLIKRFESEALSTASDHTAFRRFIWRIFRRKLSGV